MARGPCIAHMCFHCEIHISATCTSAGVAIATPNYNTVVSAVMNRAYFYSPVPNIARLCEYEAVALFILTVTLFHVQN
jgi:hypothetical protein